MELEKLKRRFFTIVSPSLPNEWEVEDVVSELLDLPEDRVEILFEQISVIWPVSHSLCFAYLLDSANFIACIPREHIAEWSRQILSLYETGGLLAARKLMADPEKMFLAPMEGFCGVDYSDIAERMQLYLDGLSRGSLGLNVGDVSGTDTGVIYVPERLYLFSSQVENTRLYKFIVSLQWANIKLRVYEQYLDHNRGDISLSASRFSFYPDKQKAENLFSLLQFISSFWFLEETLPGLAGRSRPLCLRLIDTIKAANGSKVHCNMVKDLLRFSVSDIHTRENNSLQLSGVWLHCLERLRLEDALDVLPEFYSLFERVEGTCDLGGFTAVLGRFDFEMAKVVINKRRNDEKSSFVALFQKVLNQQSEKERDNLPEGSLEQSEGTNILVFGNDTETKQNKDHGEYLLDNPDVELSEELKEIIAGIEDDLGELPEAYVQAASGMAGKGVNNRDSSDENVSPVEAQSNLSAYAYDEWDYRRGGYRKNWCTLYEKTVSSVSSTFIEDTLYKYRGQLHKIRRQFEMLRNQNRFVRRRRYGDDIDFDALVDALGDRKAGLAPSERVFVRLLRDRREISTCFLVDMSNSTEGWVSTAVKESLVLMMEAMEIVGDPYGIYGFSGMRRSKSEVFPIKEISQSYNSEVKGRIAAIGPKEYTRMGPPIRHMTRKMLASDSRVRLLIVFSDGKPEDYDDYKGKYAIEDTRKALLEARGVGVQVFCITIDKTAHEYLGHMFGRGQFVFIDNVEALPGKLVELYRLLTQ